MTGRPAPRTDITSGGFEVSLRGGSHWQPSRRGASLRSANVHPKHGRLSTSFARAAVAPRPAPGAATPPPSPRPPGTRALRKLPVPAPPDALRGRVRFSLTRFHQRTHAACYTPPFLWRGEAWSLLARSRSSCSMCGTGQRICPSRKSMLAINKSFRKTIMFTRERKSNI